jgi:hypothetical protein
MLDYIWNMGNENIKNENIKETVTENLCDCLNYLVAKNTPVVKIVITHSTLITFTHPKNK